MDYFSGLKKAFDNIDNEMTRSLVGNKEQPHVEPHVIEETSSSKVCSSYMHIAFDT